jgi:large subunit ribosomal protein L33
MEWLSKSTHSEEIMAKKGNTVIVKLRSSESDYRYYTTKNKKNTTARMEIKKYDPTVRRHVAFKEER